MKRAIFFATAALLFPAAEGASERVVPSLEERLERFLQRFPESDFDRDGRVTRDELDRFNRERKEARLARKVAQQPPPPHGDVAYGEHAQQRFDLWPVEKADKPVPLVIFIHGGGFFGGDKRWYSLRSLEKFQSAGIAYREDYQTLFTRLKGSIS